MSAQCSVIIQIVTELNTMKEPAMSSFPAAVADRHVIFIPDNPQLSKLLAHPKIHLTELTADSAYRIRVFSVLDEHRSFNFSELVFRTKPASQYFKFLSSFSSSEARSSNAAARLCHHQRLTLEDLAETSTPAKEVEVAGDLRSVLVDNLSPDSFYRVSIYAITSDSIQGLTSVLHSTQRIPAELPTGPPKNATSKFLDANGLGAKVANLQLITETDSISLTWSKPAELGPVALTGYSIKWGESAHKFVPENTLHYTIEHLQPNTRYTVSIIPMGRDWQGVPTEEEVSTKEEPLESHMPIPMNLRSTSTGSNWLSLRWDPVVSCLSTGESCVPLSYQVHCQFPHQFASHRSHENGVFFNVSENVLTLQNLSANQKYNFAVRSVLFNPRNQLPVYGPWSLSHVSATKAFVDNEGLKFQLLGDSVPQLKLSWHSVQFSKPLKEFQLRYTEERYRKWKILAIRSEIRERVFSNLKPGALYLFQLIFHFIDGKFVSDPIEAFRMPDELGNQGGKIMLKGTYHELKEIPLLTRNALPSLYTDPELEQQTFSLKQQTGDSFPDRDKDEKWSTIMLIAIIIGSVIGSLILVLLGIIACLLCAKSLGAFPNTSLKNGRIFVAGSQVPTEQFSPSLPHYHMSPQAMGAGATDSTLARSSTSGVSNNQLLRNGPPLANGSSCSNAEYPFSNSSSPAAVPALQQGTATYHFQGSNQRVPIVVTGSQNATLKMDQNAASSIEAWQKQSAAYMQHDTGSKVSIKI
ncbi:hypothetical protein Ciccas_006191 [Cichlidogyrus casuarinus]|uniref:Fibronectin type-III domain-containing protein n=1 Tax=Cichlidogyrus casuarinus TaxID=1844966 RepID=A0ABD2Q6H1_9PLAT